MRYKDFTCGAVFGYLLTICLLKISSHLPATSFRSPAGDVRLQSDGKEGKLLCWIVTAPQNQFKALVIKETWGRRCDKLLFFSSQNDTSIPTIGLQMAVDSRNELWTKAQLTFRYIYANLLDDYDWFFKADDDTYAIVENLKHLLSRMDPSEPLILGRRFRDFVSGGSGYVLTKETIRRLVEEGLDRDLCHSRLPGRADDLILAMCLEKLGIVFGDTRDEWGHQTFVPYRIEEFYSGTGANMDFLRASDLHPHQMGYNCCSNEAISFHYVSGYTMKLYEYLIYKLKVVNRIGDG